MKTALAQPELAPIESLAPAPVEAVTMFERLACDPNVPVEKLERLIAMQERILDRNAKAAFDAAFAEMQPKIPCVIEKAKTDKGTYAPLEDINAVVLPIINAGGFSLSFRTEWPDAKTVKVIGILTHRDGHARESEFMSAADASGSKNAIQGLGSAVTYGRRYVTKDLLNITTREYEDDGRATSKIGAPDVKEPAGFRDWWLDMEIVADEGFARLSAAWESSKPEFRTHALATNKAGINALKAKSRTVKVQS